MHEYKKLVDFVSKRLGNTKADYDKELEQIWGEKEKLIDKVLVAYCNTFAAYCDCKTAKSYFADELIENDKLEKYIKSPDWKSEVSIDSAHSAKNSPFNEDLLIETYDKILSPNYDPKKLDMFEKRNHLCALWFFYKMLPVLSKEPLPLNVVMKFDLSMMKLIVLCSQLLTALQYTGSHHDSELKRYKAIRHGRGTEENKRKSLEGYKLISWNGQTQNGLAVQIRQKLCEKYSQVPSLDTIKRHLKREKLPPFD